MRGVVEQYYQPEIVIKALKATARGNLEKACKTIVAEIRKRMLESKTGRTYYLQWIGEHVAAADGEAPARRYGDLYNAVEYKIEDRGNELVGIIGVNLDEEEIGYAYFLEVGFTVGGKKYQKPYIRSTVFENEDEILKILGA